MRAGNWKHGLTGAALAVLVLTGTGCSSPPKEPDAKAAYDEANDPWEPFNRYIFEVNYAMDQLFFRPIAGMYRLGVPEPVRDGIRNFLRNLRSPLIVINDLLQGEPGRAGETLQRFLVNSTLGLGGFIDVADAVMDVPFHDEDFGQTLGVWGMEEGWYVMLPFFGPSNPRDTVGIVADGFMDPVSIMMRLYDVDYGPFARSVLTALDHRSRNIDTLDDVERTAIDYYATIRSLYRQRREDEIRNGIPSANLGAPTITGQRLAPPEMLEETEEAPAPPAAAADEEPLPPPTPVAAPILLIPPQVSQQPQADRPTPVGAPIMLVPPQVSQRLQVDRPTPLLQD